MICPSERSLFAISSEILVPAHLCAHGTPVSPACRSTQYVSDQGSHLRVTHSQQQIWCLCKFTSLTTNPYPRSSLGGAVKLPVGQENQSSVLQDAARTQGLTILTTETEGWIQGTSLTVKLLFPSWG